MTDRFATGVSPEAAASETLVYPRQSAGEGETLDMVMPGARMSCRAWQRCEQ